MSKSMARNKRDEQRGKFWPAASTLGRTGKTAKRGCLGKSSDPKEMQMCIRLSG